MISPKKYLNIPVANTRYVSKDGDDTLNDGSFSRPFLTIAAAMASILTAGPTNRFSIMLSPGTYTEDVVFKANVFIVGTVYNSTRIIGNASLDATFTPAGDSRSGFANCYVSGLITLDFLALTSNEGKFACYNCRLGGGILATSFSTINQMLFYECETFGAQTINGMNSFFVNCTPLGGSGPITCNFLAGGQNELSIYGGNFGEIVINGLAGAFNVNVESNIQLGVGLTLNGPTATISATSSSLPLESLITYAGGATAAQIDRINDGFGVGYSPSVPADWSPAPTKVSEALDQLAANAGTGPQFLAAGQVTLAAGTASVAVPTIAATDAVLFSRLNGMGSGTGHAFATITAGVGFDLSSIAGADATAEFSYSVVRP